MIARIQQLPEEQQELLARFVLRELDEDAAWRRSGKAHGNGLERLVTEIMTEDARGDCPALDVNDL